MCCRCEPIYRRNQRELPTQPPHGRRGYGVPSTRCRVCAGVSYGCRRASIFRGSRSRAIREFVDVGI